MTCIHEAQTDLIVSLILREFELVQSRLPCLVFGDGVMEQHEVISTHHWFRIASFFFYDTTPRYLIFLGRLIYW